MTQTPVTYRTAWTLTELLVVLSVLSMLLALAIPAVVRSRHMADRLSCQNNLHQMGIALADYHHRHGTFPPGGIEWRPANDRQKRQLSWCAFLLPYLEQQSVYDRLNLNEAFDSPVNAPAAATILPVFICPSSPRGSTLVQRRGPCDYGGIYGERITSPNQPPKGLMVYDRRFAIHDVPDGLSNTLIVAEDTGWLDGQWINGRILFDQAYPINAAPPYENDIRSHHPGGANGLTADGAVHFLDQSMDLRVLAAICTRSGGEWQTPW